MTHKQQLFILEYLKDFNATRSALEAGYSKKTAYSIGNELLKNPEIQEAINSAMKQREERTEITQDYVLQNLTEIVERTMQRKPVMSKGEQATDENGNNLWTFDAKNAIKALELLGRHLGMFTDKIQAELKDNTLADFIMAEYQEGTL